MYAKLFNESHSIHISLIWKTAKVIPVPKKPNPSELNDYRPVALTSVPFKCLERLVLNKLLCHVEPQLDSQQLAYRKGRSVEDATLSYIQVVSKHLDFLTNRRKYVYANGQISSVIVINIGSPQGCVLSAVLFILYTNGLIANKTTLI